MDIRFRVARSETNPPTAGTTNECELKTESRLVVHNGKYRLPLGIWQQIRIKLGRYCPIDFQEDICHFISVLT